MEKKNSKNLRIDFVNLMINKILSGEYKQGDRLKPERELAIEYGISRGSINQGILDLERMGFLKVNPRKGTYVTNYSKNATPETLSIIMNYDSTKIDNSLFLDMMDLRILVECECTRLACQKMNKENIELLKHFNNEIYSVQDDLIAEAIYNYHKCISEISGNSAYTIIFQSFKIVICNLIDKHYADKEEKDKNIPKFNKLTKALINKDEDKASKIIKNMLSQAKKYLDKNLK